MNKLFLYVSVALIAFGFSSVEAGSPSSPGVGPLNVSITGGNAGGDLGSTYPNPSVLKVHSVAYPASPSTNTVPVVTGSNTVTYEAVPNAALANSSVTIAGHSVSLGGTQAIACADLSNGASGCSTAVGTIATQAANSVTITGGTLASMTSIGIGGATGATAVLDAQSTTKGFLPPRMTTVQKLAISTPAEGLVVYDTTLQKLCVFTGTVWETITSV